MKKIIVLLLTFCILLCACGKKDKEKNGAKESETDTDTDTVSVVSDIDTATFSEPEIMPANATFDNLSNEKICFGCGTEVDENNRTVGAVSMQEEYGEHDALFIGEPTSCIYLTFDEGYENGYTSQILDTLKDKGVSATFFVTLDYVKKNKDLITRMINEGHVVGNHTCSHPSMPDLTVEEMTDEIMGLENYVYENFGYKMTTFRPPMGEFSERSLALTQSLGYETVLWSFAYKDWLTDDQPECDYAYDRITSATHDGAVYLLHAVSSTNTSVLGSVIEYWRESGYEIKAVGK